MQYRAVSHAEIIETILLRRGYYYGRAYRQGALVATLTAETGTVCICTDGGQLLRTIELGGEAAVAAAPPLERADAGPSVLELPTMARAA